MGKFSIEYLETILKSYSVLTSVSKVVEVVEEPGLEKGRNYISDTQRIKFKVINGSGKECEMCLFVKIEPETPNRQEYSWSKGAFPREIKMYREILPNMSNLLQSCGDFADPLWPDCLAHHCYNTIILEDLARLGYTMLKTESLDFDHSLLAICALARFHASSAVLKEKFLLDPKDFKQYWFLERHVDMEGRFNKNLETLASVMKSDWSKEWHLLADDLKKVTENLVGEMGKSCKDNDSGFHVLIHGDPWLANMMFKYCPFTGKVIGVRLVDFQAAYYGSYAIDLSFFLHTSASSKVRDENLKELVSAYHKTLEKTFQTLGHFPKNIPSEEDVHTELKKKEKFGLIISLSLLNFHIADLENSVSFENYTKSQSPSTFSSIFYSQQYTEVAQGLLRSHINSNLLK